MVGGKWKGTYTYVTYHTGNEEPAEIEIYFHEDIKNATPDTNMEALARKLPDSRISSRFFSGNSSDVWGSYDIYGQCIATEKKCTVWYVKLYDKYGCCTMGPSMLYENQKEKKCKQACRSLETGVLADYCGMETSNLPKLTTEKPTGRQPQKSHQRG